ncbi:MAG: hypothetical protein ACK5XX_00560 [Holosporales bacterium]|jgi:hypothetical protein|nr:hypothetical protein [Thalassospira sp.]
MATRQFVEWNYYLNCPEGVRYADTKKVKAKRGQEEFKFQCVAADYLNRVLPPEVRWLHIPNGEYRTPATAGRLKRMGVKKGVWDIIILHAGRSFWCELKATDGDLTDEQEDWGTWFGNNGFHRAVIKTLNELEAFLKANGIPLRGVLQ